jgi:hypothetical protein
MKKNTKKMIKQIKCVKATIVKNILQKKYKIIKHKAKKLKKIRKYPGKPTRPEYHSYPSKSRADFESSRTIDTEKIKSKFIFGRIKQKLNISSNLNLMKNIVKKKILRLLKLENCFEEEEVKYGFRTKVTLVENSPCILGSTCRGFPVGRSRSESDFIRKELELNLNQDELTSDLYEDNPDFDSIDDNYFDRQTGEEFSSDGPPGVNFTNIL